TVLAVGGAPGRAFTPMPWETNQDVLTLFEEGRHEDARQLIEEALGRYEQHAVLLYNLACAEARQRHVDEAFEWLGKAIDAGFDAKGMLRTDDDLDNLRSDPRFRELIRRTELAGR
ncbi:MAG TPA: tetratricopeptide repeat protein, partial [Myxococcales bacterium]|nr:tetratricopeptide repeat protein [Myxococcales bacterium]